MVSLRIPEMLFNEWFWLTIIVIGIAIHYFFGKPPAPRKPNKFFFKHKQTITRGLDIFIIFVVVFNWFIPLKIVLRPLLTPSSTALSFAEELKIYIAFSSVTAIGISGSTGVLIGLLSAFRSILTKTKRIILLAVSLMPIAFIALLLLTAPVEWADLSPSTIKIGLISFFWCMVINGPAIFAGQHFTRVMWSLMHKLKLVSGEYPEWW